MPEYCPDNYDQYRKHEREQHEREKDKPRCAECGRPIRNEYAYRIGCKLYCRECVEDAKEYIQEE